MLNTALLKQRLRSIDPTSDDIIEKMSAALEEWVTGATVTVNVTTTVTGTCATPAGAGTIAGSGTGSGTGQIS